MESLLEWARGPFFWAALSFMVLGLTRRLGLTLWGMHVVLRRAGDKKIPYGKLAMATLAWVFPVGTLKSRTIFGLTNLLFHVATLAPPVFLAGHIVLWRRGLGISWPALPAPAADCLTALAVVTAAALVAQRVLARDTRALSRLQDYLLPLFIAVPFVSGFLVKHPSCNFLPYELLLLVHVASSNVLIILIPLTKLSHCVLLPETQFVSELAWHWPPDAGRRVGAELGKENEAI